MKYAVQFLSTLLLLTLGACSTASATIPAMKSTAANPTVEVATATSSGETKGFDLSQDLKPIAVTGNYLFAEGPATDPNGNVYFSDINAGKIYKWSMDGSVTLFIEGLNLPNGLIFSVDGSLVVCEGGNGRLISIDLQGQITVLADQYNGIRFNEPNDLWIDPKGGIYFTDPAYQSAVVQDGEHVYYLSPDRSQVTRAISDMVRPNGIIGTADGTMLYVADHGASRTFVYDITADGSLLNKRLFVSTGSDGMALDPAGNLYLTTPNRVQVYSAAGNHLMDISIPESPTNVTFSGAGGQILFITARTAVYTIQMSGEGSSAASDSTPFPNMIGFTLTSPDLPPDGRLPAEYTCDGAASSLALKWSGAPEGTVGYAVIMHHIASMEDVHWYLVLYNLPADVTSLPKNFIGLGTLGNNSVNGRTEYAPPCSRGPGDKTYTYTVYALSAQPQLSVPPEEVNRATLLAAIQDITLTTAELNVLYARP